MSMKDVLSPFTAWKNLLKEPVTIKEPLKRKAAPRYRGFHKNDIHECIGCGSCESICQNAAIDLVPVEGIETKNGDSGLRPRVDYGRCCWCGLCVDICATGSLSLSNHFKWIDNNPDVFRFTPGVDKKEWDNEEEGYKRPDWYTLNPLGRVHMEELAPEKRHDSFIEIVKGFSHEQALKEADRCVSCGLCVATCPAHMGIPQYIKAIRDGNLEDALKILYETNPLPEVCGRVCTHKCETVCAVGHRGDPVSIRWLKRYIADQIPESEYAAILGEPAPETQAKIAVVGAGPSGLSAAYYLSRMGHKVVIFESLPKPGGMMRYGIPEYRLPYDDLDKDIDFIISQGVEIRTNTRIGKDITLEELHREYKAVFIATGLHLGRSTRIKGSEHEQVYQAIDLLRDVTQGKDIPVARKIAVVGGGNVAMDIARTLARLQRVKYGEVNITLTCLEDEGTMPADREEIVEAREEGVTIIPGWGPRMIEVEDGRIKGLALVRCMSVFGADGKFCPSFDDLEVHFVDADMVVESIGQGMDLSYIGEELKKDIKVDGRGRPEINAAFQTTVPWLFAGGDIVEGPDVIHGIANGHTAAKGIDRWVRGDTGK